MEVTERYVSLYRKYRPVTFDSVIGQETIVRILKGSVESGRISHAYLFSGPKGTGKTTVARILAKALNCEKGPTSSPCMACEHCKAITAGNDIDVIEIDAASNRGIDEIRDLRESTRFVPARSRKKIFIIDEAHMLTVQAFNALLKTLEEPPEYVVFILATTEPQKLPETILSRCQRFDFKRIPDVSMLEFLRKLRDKEAPHITDDALRQIVDLSDGSMRGAIGLVDQFSVFGDESVTGATVLDLLGLPTEENLILLVKSLLDRDPKAMSKTLDQLERAGIEPADLVERTIALVSSYLLDKVAGKDVADGDGRLAEQFSAFPDSALINLISSFSRIQQQLVYLSNPYPLLQAFLLAIALGLPFGTEVPHGFAPAVSFKNVALPSHPVEQAVPSSAQSATAHIAEPEMPADREPVSTLAETHHGPQSDQWERFKSLVTEASKPIGIMLQALDVQEVTVADGTLHIILGPKAKLYRAMLEQKRDETLVPAARTIYAVEKVVLAEKGSSEAKPSDGEKVDHPDDDKLELLKKTFDATESLFGS